jgi:L-amino acid N-acyltransferase YncA
MNIRTATFEDIEEIVEIYNQVIAAGQKTVDIAPVTAEDCEKWFKDHTPGRYPILVTKTF